MKKIFLFVFCLFVGTSYGAQITDMPERLGHFSKNLESVSASFNQIKLLPESTKRFVATGRVKFTKNQGFIWMQDTPKKQVFVSTKEKYCVDGVAQDLNSLPYFSYVRKIIDDVLNGDISRLQTVFSVEYIEYGKNSWQLTARPRFDAIADILQDVVMYGTTDDLDKIIITYNNGTVVIINFKRMNTEISDEIAC